MANRNRSKQVIIRLSDEEYQKYMEQVEKSNLTQNEFFIKCIAKKKIIVIDGLKETLIELKKVGVNLNQVSKNLNSGIFQNAENELKKIRQQFANVSDKVIEILKGVK